MKRIIKESAKLHALRALVPYTLRPFVSQVPVPYVLFCLIHAPHTLHTLLLTTMV